ncbi:MAG: FkbM family methyltransferase [Planctomycetota bacterium]
MRGWRKVRDWLAKVARVPRRWIGHPDLRSLRRRSDLLQQDVERLLFRRHVEVATEEYQAQQVESGNLHEARGYSQNGEDGLLLHILSQVGVAQRRMVEIGCGPGRECNSALLSCVFGWQALLFDSDAGELAEALEFFQAKGAGNRVRLVQQEVRPENIDQLLASEANAGELDVLSIDVDGIDFWIWKNLTILQPRIVVIEVNASYGPAVSRTVPWSPGDPHHDGYRHHVRGWHHGASLRAMEALGRSKGYRLVALESTGTNAFFLRGDLSCSSLPALDPQRVWRPHRVRSFRHSPEQQARSLESLPFLTVNDDGDVERDTKGG